MTIAHGALGHFGLVVLGTSALILALNAALLASRARLGPRGPRWHHLAAALAGALVLGVALSPLLDVERSLSAHMLQHALLVGVAAPLLALGMPLLLFLCLLPRGARRRVHRARRIVGRDAVPLLILAVGAHVVVVTGWHIPWLYERATAASTLHVLEHGLFVATALGVWWLVVGGGTPVEVSLGRLIALVVLVLHGAALGSLVAFSPVPWYETYEGPDGLADQQLGGLIMWTVGGAAPALAAFALVVVWLEPPRRDPAGPVVVRETRS